jgi:molybdopterin-guanine dinucleotide biosynthesis protein A
MGRDKAWVELGGRPMISHVLDALKPAVTETAVIANSAANTAANRAEYELLGVLIVADENPGIGPIEAVRTALASSRYDRLILVGCDMPFVTAELFRYLLSRCEGYDSVVPLGPDNKLEPLCAVYSRQSLAEVERMIASGQFKISPLFERIPTLFVEFKEFSVLNGSELFFENINTPEQYRRALALGGSSR